MSKANDKLTSACQQVEALADEALSWCASAEGLLGFEGQSLDRHLQGLRQRVIKLQEAVGRKPAVAIAGPCGSGKTHLAAGLAGRGPEPLLSKFEGFDTGIDFLQQIRCAEAQASGVVVRFSSDDHGTPTKFPVELSLLTSVDLIKILGAAYLSAATSAEVVAPTPADIEALAKRLTPQLSPFAISGLNEQQVWSVRDYFERYHAGSSVVRALAAGGYWDYLSAMLPRLPHEVRLEMLSLLWGGIPYYTMLFDRLVVALEKLGFEERAYCSLAAIVAIEPETSAVSAIRDSIINIDPLVRIGQSDDETVVVRSKHGAWAAIGRGVLGALTKEVRICLQGQSSELLAKADIIEFPGLHSVGDFTWDGLADQQDRAASLDLFVRHKARHLFQEFHQRQEITSLVICVAPGSKNISGLSQQVTDWVESAHGQTPGERERIDTGLFVVLTKLDQVIPLADNENNQCIDWSERIDTVLGQGVGWNADWTQEWTTGRPFDQLFLLRSPHHKAPQLCDYLGNGLELCIKSSRRNHVSIARERFVENETVRRHVTDPSAAWQEALEPGDGGISLLSQSVAAVCNELARRRQITSELANLRHAMAARLQRFHVFDDVLEQLDLRHRSAQVVLRALQVCSDKRLLGKLLRSLHVGETEFAALFHNLETNPYRRDTTPVYASTLSEKLSESLKHLNGEIDHRGPLAVDTLLASNAGAGGENPATSTDSKRDREEDFDRLAARYAHAACEYWAGRLRVTASAPDLRCQLGLSYSTLAFLVDELLAAAQRHNLRRELASRIKKSVTTQAGASRRIATAAIVAEELFSVFTNCLGFDESWAEHHPRRKGREQAAIFSPRQETGLASVSEVRARLGTGFFNDWSVAYLAMIEDNADYLRSTRTDFEQEQKLGMLLGDLAPQEFWPAFRSVS